MPIYNKLVNCTWDLPNNAYFFLYILFFFLSYPKYWRYMNGNPIFFFNCIYYFVSLCARCTAAISQYWARRLAPITNLVFLLIKWCKMNRQLLLREISHTHVFVQFFGIMYIRRYLFTFFVFFFGTVPIMLTAINAKI